MKFHHPFILTVKKEEFRKYESDGIVVTLRFVGDACLKVTVEKNCQTATGAAQASAPETLKLGNTEIRLKPDNFLLSYFQNGALLFSDRAPLAYNFENEFGSGMLHYVTREKNEKIYGLGDKGGRLNKNGRSFKIETTDTMGYDAENSDPLYKHVPFYICENDVGCYGVYYDTDATATMDFGREHNNYYTRYKYFQCEEDTLCYYVFFGTKLEILQQFCRLMGKQAFPPKWSFDYCGSTMAYTDAPNAYEEMCGFIEKLKEYNLSCRGFYLSSGYTSIGDQRCVFHWNYDKFPDPAEFIRVFRNNGIEIIPNIKPAFLVTHPMYNALKEQGLFIKNPDGSPFVTQFWDNLGSYLDFTKPQAKTFWKEQVTTKLLDFGIRATWNDNNEFDIKDSDAQTDNGAPACRLRPELTQRMVEASFEAQKEKYPTLRPFLSTRSGNAKVRRYAQTWSGDNFTSFNDLKYCHFIGLTMSLSGFFFYGHDLGGFSGEMPSKELLLRWLQHGVFEPRFTIHSWNDDGSATMPWSYPDLMPSVRCLMAQRARLIPYLYNCAYNAVEDEIPMNAPLFLYYNDSEIDENGNTFMVGRDLLAICVLDEGQTTAKAYLPQDDDWYFKNRFYKGGQRLTVELPAEGEAACFVRAGSIIPINTARYGFQMGEKIALQVYAKESGTFVSELFFDDGESEAYLENNCAHLLLEVQCNEDTVTVSCKNIGKMSLSYEVELIDFKNRTKILK